jgi:ubiquinone/menaquinone biosynthesis C-methylase UbiE/uncharacterized protein YbaR (Trm112 family)
MKRRLLDVLRCPDCGGAFHLRVARDDNELDIQEGKLKCRDCLREFGIRRGVPDLILDGARILQTRKSFEYQWTRRLTGLHEDSSRCYGFLVKEFVDWLMSYGALADVGSPNHWILDLGCGSAEKTALIAAKYPDAEVVGLDLSSSLRRSAEINSGLPNLHLVQADLLHPPFSKSKFSYVLSIGVLHHTPDTREAFAITARLLQPRGGLLTWIYPASTEDPFWNFFYRQRDRTFAGVGHRLPPALLMIACRLHVFMSRNKLSAFFSAAKASAPAFPFVRHMSKKEMLRTAVFLTFDNLAPPYQHRHSREEVLSWYRQHQFEKLRAEYPGFVFGTLFSSAG